MERRKEILITNDDGIEAKGLHILADMMKKYGHVTVVAPARPQSGKSAALTMDTPLYLDRISEDSDVAFYSFTGTPVDCVKIAMGEFYSRRLPDLLMSGINHGSNCSVASLYSGTLGACIEGTLYEVPSMGFSINTHSGEPDFSPVLKYGDEIIEKFIERPASRGIYLNVNFPAVPADDINGIRFGRRGYGRWAEEFDSFTDDNGRRYFVMGGYFKDLENSETGDHILVGRNYISIVPHSIDNTDYRELDRLKKEWNY